MSDLIVITYPDLFRAAEVLNTVSRLQAEHVVDLDDACYVTKDTTGNLQLHHASSRTADGALKGGFLGALVGLLFLNPVVGGLIGAAEGALLAATGDTGITNDFVDSVSQHLLPDTSALFILVRRANANAISVELAKYGGTILETSLPEQEEARLRARFEPVVAVSTPVPDSAPDLES